MAPGDSLPSDPKKGTGGKVHHLLFGVKHKVRVEKLGIEAHVKHPGAKPNYPDLVALMAAELGRK